MYSQSICDAASILWACWLSKQHDSVACRYLDPWEPHRLVQLQTLLVLIQVWNQPLMLHTLVFLSYLDPQIQESLRNVNKAPVRIEEMPELGKESKEVRSFGAHNGCVTKCLLMWWMETSLHPKRMIYVSSVTTSLFLKSFLADQKARKKMEFIIRIW